MFMDAKKSAEEFFWTIVRARKSLSEIPQNCSQGENGVLVYLSFFDKCSPSEISEKLNLSLPRIATILTSLESKKLIRRKLDCDDKRKSIVEITEEGKKIVEDKRNDAICDIAKVFEKLDVNEREEYIHLTQKIINIISDIHK